MADLRSYFPGLFESDGGEQAWQNQVLRLSWDQPYQLLGSGETERRLDEILRVKTSDRSSEKNYELTQFPIFLKDKSAKKTLAVLGHDLENLATRAHPIYAPIIAEYAQITALLRRGKTLNIPRRLERLQNLRKAIAAQMREIDDYLNWFEATSMARPSGEFADYLKAARRASRSEQTKRDPISVYLDALEIEFDDEGRTVR
jgi:hypothetical protein